MKISKVISTTVVKLDDNTLLQHAVDQEKSFSKSNSTPIVETEGSYSKPSSAQMVDMGSSSNRPSSTLELEREGSFSKPSSINRITTSQKCKQYPRSETLPKNGKQTFILENILFKNWSPVRKHLLQLSQVVAKRVTYIGGHSSGCIYKKVPNKHCEVDNASIGIQQLNASVEKSRNF